MFFFHNRLLFNSFKLFLTILPVENISFFNNEFTLSVKSCYVFSVLKFLKQHTHCQFNVLVSVTAVDYLHQLNRFELNYDLLSLIFNNRLRIKVYLDELELVESCEHLYKAASWYECEVWDMFGIYFTNHSNLKRILTDYGFEGYPLRKDFPLCGFIEIKYNELHKRIVTNSIELSQEYRTFNFLSPWASSQT